MSSVYTETLELRACSCDMSGAWKPSAILETMQETAGVHSRIFGLSRDVMDAMNIAWVLSRLTVRFDRVPVVGETITVETYPTPNRHMFFPRTHIFRDDTGAQVGCANSLWVLMDLTERKLTRSDEVLAHMPDNTGMAMLPGMPATVKPLSGEPVTGEVIPRYSELDMNRHVNNTKYLDWCVNALGVDVMAENCITAFDVNYDAEILPGSVIRTELTRDGEKFSFCGFDGAKRHFSVGGTLAAR